MIPIEKQKLLTDILESITDGLMAIDRDWRISYINEAAAHNLNVTPEDLLGKEIWQAYPALRGTPLETQFRRVMETRETVQFEMKGVIRDKWFTVSVYSSTTGITVFWSDNSSRPHTEIELKRLLDENQRQSALLTAIFEVDPSGLAVLVGPELRFAYVNPAYRYITPDPQLDPIGKPYDQVWPRRSTYSHRDRYREVLETGQPFRRMGVEHLFPDGSHRTFTVQVRRIEWDDQPAVLLVHWDTSEQNRIEAVLREREQALIRANEAAESNLAEMRAIIDNMGEGLFVTDARGNFLVVNQAARALLGIPENSAVTVHPAADRIEIQDSDGNPVPLDQAPLMRALRGETLRNAEYVIHRLDTGKHFTALFNAAPVLGRDGAVWLAVATVRDITERKQAREAMAANLAAMELIHDVSTRFTAGGDTASILEAVLDAAIQISGADRGNVQTVDPETHTLLVAVQRGFDRPFLEFLARADKNSTTACAEALRLGRRVVVEDVEASPAARNSPDVVALRAAGVRAVQSTPLITRTGKIVGVLTTHWRAPFNPEARTLRLIDLLARQAADITERIQAEGQLLESEVLLRRALEIQTIGVIFSKTDGAVIDANAAFLQMTGYSREDLENGLIRLDRMTPPEWMPQTLKALEELKTTGRSVPYEKECYRKDGSRYWALFAATRLKDDIGLEYIIDITERKQAQDDAFQNHAQVEVQRRLLGQREQERQQIARDLHDGPIQELIGLTFALQEMAADGCVPEMADRIKHIQAEVQAQIAELRGYAGELRPPTLARFGLASAIRSHADAFKDKHPGVKVTFQGSQEIEDFPEEKRLALYRIYQEVMTNIAKHAQATQVAIRLTKTPTRAVLEIQDNGVGFVVPRDWLALARQGHLGLVGINERAEAVSGTVEITSHLGQGTFVQVKVPLHPTLEE